MFCYCLLLILRVFLVFHSVTFITTQTYARSGVDVQYLWTIQLITFYSLLVSTASGTSCSLWGFNIILIFCSVLLEHTSLDCKNPETGRINSNYCLIEVGSRRHGVCTISCGPTWFLWVFSRNPCHRNTLTSTKGEMKEGTLAVRW